MKDSGFPEQGSSAPGTSSADPAAAILARATDRDGAPRTAADGAGPRAEWRRAARLWAVVACFMAVGLARSVEVGIPFRDPHGTFLADRVVLTVGVFLGLLALDALVRTGRPLTLRRVVSTVRSRWTPGRLTLAWAALPAYHLTYFTYRNLKSWDVLNSPRDAMLTGWDRWLFLGHSPAVLLHDLLGQHAAARVLVAWYQAFPLLVMVAYPAAVVLATRIRDAYVGIAAFVWVWILGTATYYLIPSLGPFQAQPADFSDLPRTVVQANQARYLVQRDHLLANPHAGDAYAQVSAFASLHVGVTATILGLAWWHGLRRTTIVLGVFLAGTMVATVYLGWHFAVDVPAGLAIAALAWWLAPRTVGVRGRPSARRVGQSASQYGPLR